MRRSAPLAIVAVLFGILLLSGSLAQNKNLPARVGFVDPEILFATYPGSQVGELQKQAATELQPLKQALSDLQNKINNGTATTKNKQDLLVAQQAYEQASRKWSGKIDAEQKKIAPTLDRLIQQVAKQQGFSVIMDRRVAAASRLVIYAAPDTDITQAVIAAMKKQ